MDKNLSFAASLSRSTSPLSTTPVGKRISQSPLSRFSLIYYQFSVIRALFQNVAKPVTELSFPSVTICSPGLNMEAVQDALLDDFNIWLKEEGKMGGSSKERFDEYVEEKYAAKVVVSCPTR